MASKAYPTTTFKNFFFNLPAAGAAGPIVKASAPPAPTHNPRPTAHMRDDPQYRPPSGPKARPRCAAEARA